MMPKPRYLLAVLAVIIASALAWWALAGQPARGPEELARRGPLALFTSLPIYWGEAAGMADLLDPDAPRHWVRDVVERSRALQPVDTLEPAVLAPFRDLLLAQPRALSPAENVALDDWVRGGGRLLLFADPLLTEESHFPLGDSRRPQDVVLLSPILARWGLELSFDDAQQGGERMVRILGQDVPVALPGKFALRPTAPDAPAHCSLLADGAGAECRIGGGLALILADAAVLDAHHGGDGAREQVFLHLMTAAYAPE